MPPFIIAHRGDSAHRPENTLAAFASALEEGVEMVECDVQFTRDGQVVVIHDPTVDRTTSGRGRVGDLTLAEIRAFSAGYPERFGRTYAGERVPTLAETLGLLRGRARLMIEIKSESVTGAEADGIEAQAITEVRKANMTREVAFLSFDRRALLRCREQAPEIPRGHLFLKGQGEEMVAGAREAACGIVMPEKSALSDEIRDAVRGAGLKLASWVVDDPQELHALSHFDLYGVATNHPGLLLEAVADGIG